MPDETSQHDEFDDLPEYLLEYLTSPQAAGLDVLPQDQHRLRLLLTTLSMVEARAYPPTKATVTIVNCWELQSLGATIWVSSRSRHPDSDPEQDCYIHITVFTEADLASAVRHEVIQPLRGSHVAPRGAQTHTISGGWGIGAGLDWLGALGYLVILAPFRSAQRAARNLKLVLPQDGVEVPLARLWGGLDEYCELIGTLLVAGVLERVVPPTFDESPLMARLRLQKARFYAYRNGTTGVVPHGDRLFRLAPGGLTQLDAWVESRRGHTIESMAKGPRPRDRVYIPNGKCPRCGLINQNWESSIKAPSPSKKGCALCSPSRLGKGLL
jgi:hypothetical protein